MIAMKRRFRAQLNLDSGGRHVVNAATRVATGLFLGLLLLPTVAMGSSAGNVQITHLQLNRNVPNVVFIKLSVPPTSKPICSSHYWDYTLPLSGAFEEKMYATLLAVFAAGSSLDLSGLDACNEHGSIESLQAIGPHT